MHGSHDVWWVMKRVTSLCARSHVPLCSMDLDTTDMIGQVLSAQFFLPADRTPSADTHTLA